LVLPILFFFDGLLGGFGHVGFEILEPLLGGLLSLSGSLLLVLGLSLGESTLGGEGFLTTFTGIILGTTSSLLDELGSGVKSEEGLLVSKGILLLN